MLKITNHVRLVSLGEVSFSGSELKWFDIMRRYSRVFESNTAICTTILMIAKVNYLNLLSPQFLSIVWLTVVLYQIKSDLEITSLLS